MLSPKSYKMSSNIAKNKNTKSGTKKDTTSDPSAEVLTTKELVERGLTTNTKINGKWEKVQSTCKLGWRGFREEFRGKWLVAPDGWYWEHFSKSGPFDDNWIEIRPLPEDVISRPITYTSEHTPFTVIETTANQQNNTKNIKITKTDIKKIKKLIHKFIPETKKGEMIIIKKLDSRGLTYDINGDNYEKIKVVSIKKLEGYHQILNHFYVQDKLMEAKIRRFTDFCWVVAPEGSYWHYFEAYTYVFNQWYELISIN